jgi:hypothetical protein
MLCYSLVNDFTGFQVAVGYTEAANRKILGIIAQTFPTTHCTAWRVSSELDGYSRLTGISGRMSDFVLNRLRVYWQKGRFSDLNKLPQPVTVRGVK